MFEEVSDSMVLLYNLFLYNLLIGHKPERESVCVHVVGVPGVNACIVRFSENI